MSGAEQREVQSLRIAERCFGFSEASRGHE